MKNKYQKIVLLLLINLIISCKSDKKEPEKQKEKTEVVIEKPELLENFSLKVEMDFETDTKGIFQIKFRNPNTEIKPLIKYHSVKEADINTRQVISGEYDLQANDFPLYVQLIMGGDENHKIKLNEIKLITDEIIIKVNKDNFKDFISVTKYVSFDDINGVISSKKVDNVHLPVIMLNKRALDSLSM
ncbi:hypothetical protein [uncultured Winogradskyella sp.]|uniref:hypothetical protein n=1 Tax=uncultured Winogradskyella sp. TaxID=395353 RepID=UPI002627A2B0|nr:hypothetical protein [uncultured Winogradskyella sp.]